MEERYLAGEFKLAYLHGKGRQFVPVLVPVDCVQAIEIGKSFYSWLTAPAECGSSTPVRWLFTSIIYCSLTILFINHNM